MKRILVIDESEVVRETLALILGREFAVVKRPLGIRELPLAAAREEVDLLILGVTPHLGTETAALLRFAAQLPFAVLFLVDSKTIARAIQEETEIGCLAKPFNPYELHEKVGKLLARRAAYPRRGLLRAAEHEPNDFSPYLEFPFLSRSAALLARRFVAARLPLLISGELGCGQDRLVSAICGIDNRSNSRLTINAAEANLEYLSQKRAELSLQTDLSPILTTLVVESLDRCSPAGQSLLLRFLAELEGEAQDIRYVATASADLLEKVYRGDLLEALYYKLATLTLKLPPLRERQDDIPVLAEWIARGYANKLGLPEPTILPDAHLRLRNYLWFGNLSEMETVLARTLAFHRRPQIDGADLIFDFGPAPQAAALGESAEFTPSDAPMRRANAEPRLEIYRGAHRSNGATGVHAKSVELNTVIHELAHELKNPMVTIKTFAQLLGDRYQDENFRTRFQEVVGNDIERMDELLEVMIEFADFAQPRSSKVALGERLRAVLTELHGESAKRQTRFEWKGYGAEGLVQADESQLDYILKNVLLMALSEARMGSDVEIDVSIRGFLAIRYQRESARVASISHYLEEAESRTNESVLPLRVLLAKYLLERNGGQFVIDASDRERDTLRMGFPIAEH
jgi:DNA-binding NtrC family response regulator